MTRNLNIFTNIVRNENSLTELLCNLLQFKPFNNIFISLLEKKLNTSRVVFGYGDIETQNSLGEEGIPDISICNDELSIHIECKIETWTTLSRNQPTSYLKSLLCDKHKKTKAVVFILPIEYENEKELLLRQQKFLGHYKNTGIRFAVLYWHEILEYLQLAGFAELNPFFQHFINLLKDWFLPFNIIFNEEEIIMLYSKEIPTYYLKLTSVVDEVRNKLSKSFKLNREINENGYGFYFKNTKGKQILWFGIWYQFWEQKGFPLVFGVWDEFGTEVVKRFQQKIKHGVIIFEDDWHIYGIPKVIISDPNSTKQIITLLSNTAEYLLGKR